MKKIFILVMALAVVVSASVYAQGNNNKRIPENGQPRMEQRGGGNQQAERPAPKMKKQKKGGMDMSKLSETQRTEIRELNKKYSIDISNIKLDIKKQANVIKAEMMKESPSKAAIDTAIDAKAGLRAQEEKLVMEKRLAVKAIVGPISK